MTLDNKPVHFGGCQCGAVRFRVDGALGKASICHCRMCQKAFGAFYAPLVSVEEGTLLWTKAEPSRFRSSDEVQRGFCPSCGTPLTYEAPDGTALAIGAFDDPSAIAPQIQFGVEDKLAYVDRLADLPARRSSDDVETNPISAASAPGSIPTMSEHTRTPLRLSPDDWQRPDANFWRGRFEGEIFGTGASVIFYSTDEIGAGPPLHVNDYDEIFIVRQGRALFTVGEAEFEANAGDILFGPANVPHRFVNLGPGRLETTDIHVSSTIAQTDLE